MSEIFCSDRFMKVYLLYGLIYIVLAGTAYFFSPGFLTAGSAICAYAYSGFYKAKMKYCIRKSKNECMKDEIFAYRFLYFCCVLGLLAMPFAEMPLPSHYGIILVLMSMLYFDYAYKNR